MTAIVILNIAFSAFVIIGMLALLGRGIIADHRARTATPQQPTRVAPQAARRSPARVGRALSQNA